MKNKIFAQQIKQYAALLELKGENPFKLRAYHFAIEAIDKLEVDLMDLSLSEIEKISSIGKAIALKIEETKQNGIFHQLKNLLDEIPAGVVEMLAINGLGAKKINILWKENNFTTITQLLEACENNSLAQIKGFGEKMQANIYQDLLFKKSNFSKLFFAHAEEYSKILIDYLKQTIDNQYITITGQIRRKLEVVDCLQVFVETNENIDKKTIVKYLDDCNFLIKNIKECGVFVWRGEMKENGLKVEIKMPPKERIGSEIYLHSAGEKHLAKIEKNKTILEHLTEENFKQENDVFDFFQYINLPPEIREGYAEWQYIESKKIPKLLEVKDLKGIFHAHSTYSDGKNTLEEMVVACIDLGYEYLGITDHSQSAFYANGLQVGRVKSQHQEIETLRQKYPNFYLFKGIEADILYDGKLDYEDEILKTFDFVIASIHSGLKMSEEKATERIIKAIENPYTTMLGHATGRVLLRRNGYPLNMKKVIEACAKNNVIIEINASPYRLDLDWRWVHEALDKGVILSINPDSHEKNTIQEVKYGVNIGRKGGLTAEKTFNTKTGKEIAEYFENRKK
ncbi:MAG: DNA polymerase/3'-5' exonuclease PolX [Bacteroidetes bacterium]|nr:MAG: DNA polymerase/3'-5' exonuclease PolX [Bacteroidota bacterium]TAG92067.1 MAG: DNA polymerase/3'-5' exonuclease PolX [Bacteroidota bacterium]